MQWVADGLPLILSALSAQLATNGGRVVRVRLFANVKVEAEVLTHPPQQQQLLQVHFKPHQQPDSQQRHHRQAHPLRYLEVHYAEPKRATKSRMVYGQSGTRAVRYARHLMHGGPAEIVVFVTVSKVIGSVRDMLSTKESLYRRQPGFCWVE
jgi:hypothetical protein